MLEDLALDLSASLSQAAIRIHSRLSVDMTEGESIANAMQGENMVFLGNNGVNVCGMSVDYACDGLCYLERACQGRVLTSKGIALKPVDATLAQRVAEQINGERMQWWLFFAKLRRMTG